MKDNHRRRSRVNAEFQVEVCCDRSKLPIKSKNISLKGMLLSFTDRLKMDQLCILNFTLTSDIQFKIKAKVVRTSEDFGTAVDFVSMNESAFYHLRNIVRYSSEDADAIDHELITPAFEIVDDNTPITCE
ncbi:PilZ domain-containing protein [Desulfovibrio inopinatus]|uniref:PilZ domain-containing protein n=1 Tax=Desulfovibrio inopinatus TaxID=102109 RepID=UPI0003F9A95C|nr:PilZ domain-containing protein [Desulfovibrio inopinatus]